VIWNFEFVWNLRYCDLEFGFAPAPHKQKLTMVFAIQCPSPKCRKFMLVEEKDRGKVVSCLICKTAIRVGDTPRALGLGNASGRSR
jgi:hypothetical protein